MQTEKITLRTTAHDELIDITKKVQQFVLKSSQRNGMCYVFVPHTTAAVTINENADPSVRRDIMYGLNTMVPRDAAYQHSEGNSAAHIKATLLGFSLTLFIEDGQLALGTWQGIYFAEFDGPRTREVWVRVTS